jgi:small subunit ribosomal protein S20
MPITKSAKKALRQSIRRGERNTVKKDAYKTLLKKLQKAVQTKKFGDATAALSLFYKSVDKAAKVHAIAKNKASRLKSRASKLLAKATK